MSLGEEKIAKLLKENKIYFEREKSFPGLKRKDFFRFDFAIYDKNYNISALIEFDGEQHFKEVKLFGGKSGFKKTMAHDRAKNKYCLVHNIPLIRIPYYDLDKINLNYIFENEDYKVKNKNHNDFIRRKLFE